MALVSSLYFPAQFAFYAHSVADSLLPYAYPLSIAGVAFTVAVPCICLLKRLLLPVAVGSISGAILKCLQ